ncbi:hypothetical protein RJT34_25318 [Clitoria ternatea]|uniref:Uncharacterized protein n=1 Tax=Clitoria ternatea TaxID=43366 RepID=A0AAN9ILE8_CLITE
MSRRDSNSKRRFDFSKTRVGLNAFLKIQRDGFAERKDDPPPTVRKLQRTERSTRVKLGGMGAEEAIATTGEVDKFNRRQDYSPFQIGALSEKWKHELYQVVNKDPVQKNEDD